MEPVLPEVFVMDAYPQLVECTNLLPPNSTIRHQLPSHLLMAIVAHVLLDAVPTRPQGPQGIGEAKLAELCTTVSSFAAQDVDPYKYMFPDGVVLNLYEWYFQTYLLVMAELGHFFPDFQIEVASLPYTVKLYDALLRFDRIPTYRDYEYVKNRQS